MLVKISDNATRICIFKEGLASVVVLFPHMRDKQWLLVNEQVDEAAEHGRRIIDTRIGGLAEEVQ